MIEINSPETFKVLDPAPAEVSSTTTKQIGRITLRGEIVDAKCFFGVMRPALGKVHRACAIRCLSGGVPAGLRVLDGEGHESIFPLAGKPGEALALNVQLARLFVEVTGNAELMNNVALLRVESVRRLRE